MFLVHTGNSVGSADKMKSKAHQQACWITPSGDPLLPELWLDRDVTTWRAVYAPAPAQLRSSRRFARSSIPTCMLPGDSPLEMHGNCGYRDDRKLSHSDTQWMCDLVGLHVRTAFSLTGTDSISELVYQRCS